MPKFYCKTCCRIVSYAEADHGKFNNHNWECDSCYSIIAAKRYVVNQKGTTTFFSPGGRALGDNIMFQVIKDQYIKDNPDENVIFWDGHIEPESVLLYRPTKVFWADVTNWVACPAGAHKYKMSVEACIYARAGIYPEWKSFDESVDLPDKYVVISQRNINKAEEKNMKSEDLQRIIKFLPAMSILIVGNDMLFNNVEYGPYCVDYLKKLTLNQIAWVMKNASMVIGVDNGLIHLAAAAGCKNIVSWWYVSDQWFPKTRPEYFDAFLREDSYINSILIAIKKRLEI